MVELFQCENCKKKAAIRATAERLTCRYCGYWENIYGKSGFEKVKE